VDQSGYAEAATLRFTEFGGFAPVDGATLPTLVMEWAEPVLQRAERGLVTTVAFLPIACGSLLPALQTELVAYLEQAAGAARGESLGVMLLITERPLTREVYDGLQSLVYQRGRVRLVPWVVDLSRAALFTHQGPPFGIDPDLLMLADPVPERAAARVTERAAQREVRRPWLTIGLVAVLALVWLAMTVTGGSLLATERTDLLHAWGAATRPTLILSGEYWRLFTAGFIHIGLVHLLMNGVSLWWLGQLIERFYGPARMLVIYLAALVGGSVASLVLGPPIVLSAGASGAVMGLMGALAWYSLVGPKNSGIRQVPILILVLFNLFSGVIFGVNVDNWNHFGGFVAGLVAAAATGYPGQPGPRGRRLLLNGLATLVVLVATALPVTGLVALPGHSQRLVSALEAYDRGEMAEAEAGFRAAIRQQPDEPTLYSALAWSYYYQSKYAEAQSAAAEALRLDPADEGALELQQLLGTEENR